MLVQRPRKDCYTRPEGRSHNDHFLLTKNAWDSLCSDIEYAEICSERRVDSDHRMIHARFPAAGKRHRVRPQELKFDTSPLAEGRGNQYASILGRLAVQWVAEVDYVRQRLEEHAKNATEQIIGVASDTLKYLIYSASYQSLSMVRVHRARNSSKRIHDKLLQEMTTSDMW